MGRLAQTSSQAGSALLTQVSGEDTWPSHISHLATQGAASPAQPLFPPGRSGQAHCLAWPSHMYHLAIRVQLTLPLASLLNSDSPGHWTESHQAKGLASISHL